MTMAAPPRPSTYVFDFGGPIEFEVPAGPRLSTYLRASAPSTWLWCLHCERSFELAEAREAGDAVRCGYDDCAGEAPDFWSWDAYRAFAAAAPQRPRPDQRYPLAG